MTTNDENGSPLIPPLPVKTWETARAADIVAALERGDVDGAEAIRAHLVAEADTAGPEDKDDLEEISRASLLFRRSVDATAAGRIEEGAALMEQLALSVSAGTVATLMNAARLQFGRAQGWLAEDEYDRLVAYTADMGPDVAVMLRGIKRGQP